MRATGAWDPATPPRRPRKRSWTPSPRRCVGWSPGSPRHALRHAAQPWPATEPRPPRQRPAPTPGSPGPHAPESPTIFFGTPTAEERRRLDTWYAMQDATLLLGDDSDEAPESPGMARAATPLGERAERRAVLREALGDISNVSPASRGSSPAEKLATSSPAKQDSVPSLLHEWAASKFDRPFSPSKTEAASPAGPPISPLKVGSRAPHAPPQIPAAADVFSSPSKAPSAASPAQTREQKLARALIETPRTAPTHTPISASRVPAMRVPSPPKLSAQAARGADGSSEHAQTRLFRTSPFTGARRVPQPSAMRIGGPPRSEPRTGGPSPAREPRPSVRAAPARTEPLAEAPAPSPAPGRSPGKAVRVQRPARYASSVPATRVWDKPAQPDLKRRRVEPEPAKIVRRDAETPHGGRPGCAPSHTPRPAGKRAEGAGSLSNGRPALHESRQAVAPGAPTGAPAVAPLAALPTAPPAPPPTAPAAAPSAATQPAGAPSPAAAAAPRTPRTSSRANTATRTPRTPQRAATPMSATELTLLTSKHTRQNQAYNVQIQTRVQRIAGQRPPSPEPHFSQGSGATGELVRFSGDPERDLDAAGRPTRHARGAGDREEWVSPPHTRRGVRWDKRLVVSPSEAPAERGTVRGCLVNGHVQLDAHGNEVLGSAERMPRTRVMVRRRVYDDDEDQV